MAQAVAPAMSRSSWRQDEWRYFGRKSQPMCGIAGAIGDFGERTANDIVQSMTSALAHRGPDDRGFHSWTNGVNVVSLGHTRLSILDLSAAGQQPMTEQSGRYWTVFNGEIYNYLELRKLLDPDGRLFRTSTDTEVILHGYDRWSEESFRLFRGMFAFALFDKQRQTVHLARDPLGIKPLYYYISGERLLFASEVQALLASGHVPRKINREALSSFLSSGSFGASDAAISGVKLLQPGEMLIVKLSGKTLEWSVSRYEKEISVEEEGSPSDRNGGTGHMLQLLEQSVKCHLVADVPVGLFLSGGIDSTAILHLMRQAGCNALKTFTVTFPERNFSESAFARRVARRYDAEHSELQLAESDLISELPAALAAMDQPTMDGINTFIIAKAVRSAGVKVALSGLGSDELFAGYPSFRRARWARLAAKVPKSVRRTFAVAGRTVRSGPGYDKFWDLLGTDCTPQSAYRISRQLFEPTEIARILPGTPHSVECKQLRFSGDEINEMSRLETRGYMTNLLLRDTDFMSMASSLEVRVPFIDKVVVRHALQLPGNWKIAQSIPKPLLLEAMRGAVPEYVWNRRKMGFVFPFDTWMRSTLRENMEQTFGSRKTADAIGIDHRSLSVVWRRFLDGSVRWSKPWSLYVLLRWCERHGVSS